jgi:hypothetical protein
MTESPGGPLSRQYGSAQHPDHPPARPRPAGISDQTVAALGKLSKALETVEQARGFLYGFHRLSGTADLTLQEAVNSLHEAGHADIADDLSETLVGRNVIDGHWTFELVEAYDRSYWQVFRDAEQQIRKALGVPQPHVYEAEMKHREQGGAA